MRPPTPNQDSSAPTHALAPGDHAPDFALVGDDGAAVSLDSFRGKSVIVYFYPKDDTPGCTREAQAFQNSLAAIAAHGAVVVGISRDSTAKHTAFKKKYGLTFALLSDTDGAVHRAYGAWGTKKLYGKESTGALRTTVVVDPKGRVAHVFAKVKVDDHVERVVAALP